MKPIGVDGYWSGGREGLHLPAPADPGVTVSRHPAPRTGSARVKVPAGAVARTDRPADLLQGVWADRTQERGETDAVFVPGLAGADGEPRNVNDVCAPSALGHAAPRVDPGTVRWGVGHDAGRRPSAAGRRRIALHQRGAVPHVVDPACWLCVLPDRSQQSEPCGQCASPSDTELTPQRPRIWEDVATVEALPVSCMW